MVDLENTVSKILEEGHVKSIPEGMYEEADDSGRGERYGENIAFGASFSLTISLGIKREAKIS